MKNDLNSVRVTDELVWRIWKELSFLLLSLTEISIITNMTWKYNHIYIKELPQSGIAQLLKAGDPLHCTDV